MKIKQTLRSLPPWILTIVVSLAILYLTLYPDPLPDDTPKLFPGADKVVHGLMFGGLTLVILLDRQRRGHGLRHSRLWLPLTSRFVWGVALLSSVCGTIIECLQWLMGLGRGFEIADIIADTLGSFLFAFLWLLFQHRWTN